MYLCSTIQGNGCKIITTELNQFKDHYDCAIYGYTLSLDFMKKTDPKFINEYKAFVQFACKENKEGKGI